LMMEIKYNTSVWKIGVTTQAVMTGV
jgi:hypothetical protein